MDALTRTRFDLNALTLKLSVCLLLAFGLSDYAFAQKGTPRSEVIEGVRSSFHTPWSELLIKKNDSEWRNAFDGLSLGLSYNYPLSDTEVTVDDGLGSEGSRSAINQTANLSLTYSPLSYWFANISFVGYLDSELQASFNPDFTYSFGYSDWHPWTLSLVYANYGGNRLSPDSDSEERVTNFDEGTWTLGMNIPASDLVQNLFRVHETSNIGCNAGLNLVPKYMNLATLSRMDWKKSINFGCRYSFYKDWYVGINAIYYPDKEQQQPWDPDFTWGLGYFNWRPGKISVQYNNYAANRYPWRNDKEYTTRIKDGSVSVSWSMAF